MLVYNLTIFKLFILFIENAFAKNTNIREKAKKICLIDQIGDEPNLCRVKKVDVSSTFIENIFRSGLTLVSS